MLLYFARQDLTQRFSGNALGVVWAVIAPLLQLALFAFVFVYIFKARIPGLDGLGYVTFLSLGMWPWFAFAESVARGTTALTDQTGLLQKVAVAPWILVGARVLTAFGLHAFGFLLIVLLMSFVPGGPTPLYLPATLLAWAGLLVLASAFALLLAIGNVFVRDLQQIVAFALPALMFLSPILYATSMVPPAMSWWLTVNPIAGYVAAVRGPLLQQDLTPALPFGALLISAAVLGLAVVLYRRFRAYLVDFL